MRPVKIYEAETQVSRLIPARHDDGALLWRAMAEAGKGDAVVH